VAGVLLLSCYELGRQPLGLATPLAFLSRAGLDARGIDLAVEPLDEEAVRRADFVAVSVPMHTALRIALPLISRLRALNPACHLSFYGLYATLNAELLLASGVDSVLSGECEEELVARALATEARLERRPRPVLERLEFPPPERRGLPSIETYARLALPDGGEVKVGAVETTRGCLHHCRHCPIPPIYGGRFFVVPREVVLADIRGLVEAGAGHIDFVDPDFLNAPRHALAIARELHREFPNVTFDFTAKIEHLVKHCAHLKELRECGCLFVTSAVESLSDRVLGELEKGHTRADVATALAWLRDAGIDLRPTFVAFTPWTSREDYLDLVRWIAGEGLVLQVEPIQLALRLLIPPGSLLLRNESLSPHLGGLDPEALTYRWTHPDPGMDELQAEAETLVEAFVREGRSSHEAFHALAELALGSSPEAIEVSEAASRPRLTESWFC
jgi:radical SAM superfamily enzyme YgiQ (UPF0313 family)